MKKIYISIYSTIAILVILGTVIGFIYGLIQEAAKGTDEAKRNFNFFTKSVMVLSDKDKFAETSYTEKLSRLAEELELKAFVISSEETKMLLSWFKDPEALSYNQEAGFSSKIISPFVQYLNADVTVKMADNPSFPIKISAVLSTVKPAVIYDKSRTVFFAALTVFLLTLIIILLQHISSPANEKIYANIPSSDKDIDDYFDEPKSVKEHSILSSLSNFEIPSFKETKEQESPSYSLEDLDNLNIYKKKFPYEKDSGFETTEPKDIPFISEVTETASIFKHKDSSSEKNGGLYSPITGITHKEHLEECLEMELKRAASSEQDLALVIIRLKEFNLQSLVAKRIAELLVNLIKFKDRIFEFGEDDLLQYYKIQILMQQ